MAFPWIIPLVEYIAEYISLGPVTRACATRSKTVQRSQEMLTKHREAVTADPDGPPPSLFTQVFLAEEQDEGLEPLEVVSNAVTFLVAGTDTTASALTYLVWSVCRHPEVRLFLTEELDDELPRPGADLDDARLRALPYLNQVVEETLRLYPGVAGGLLRTVPAEGADISGCWIPGGTVVSCQAYSMHRDPRVFPNPGIFYPERWAEPTAEMKAAMMAWGGGARGVFLYFRFSSLPCLFSPPSTSGNDSKTDSCCSHSLPWRAVGSNGAPAGCGAVLSCFPAGSDLRFARNVG